MMAFRMHRFEGIRDLTRELVSDSLETIAERLFDAEDRRDELESELAEANARIAELEAQEGDA